MKRTASYLIAILMLASAMVLATHSVLHVDNGFEQCLLCSSHTGGKGAVESTQAVNVITPPQPSRPQTPPPPRLVAAPLEDSLPRGPPLIS